MGFVSKQEDEIERRGGLPPGPAHAGSFSDIVLIPPDVVTSFALTEPESLDLHKLISACRSSAQALGAFEMDISKGAKQLKKLMTLRAGSKRALSDLILFVAPRVRAIHAGPVKRQMQRTVTRLKQARDNL